MAKIYYFRAVVDFDEWVQGKLHPTKEQAIEEVNQRFPGGYSAVYELDELETVNPPKLVWDR